MTTTKPFHIVIAGGGPTGLCLAHALLKADISFTILERRPEIVEFTGAALGVWPHNVRVLDQFGLLDGARKISSSMDTGKMYHFYPDGRQMYEVELFRMITEAHGHEFMLFERRAFLNLLWEGLPEEVREKGIRTSAKVVAVDEDEEGVKVRLEDGSMVEGDFVVGADGVYSTVRELMWSKAREKVPKEDKTAMVANFKVLFGCSTQIEGMGHDEGWETHGPKLYFQLFTQPGRTYWFAARPHEKPEVYPDWSSYTEEDAEAFAKEIADRPLGRSLKFKAIWDNRIRCKLTNLEQGMLKKWHCGRIVLLGDSCHKVTPNQALGANNAMESVCSLTNHLYDLLSSKADGQKPSAEELDKVFGAYQKQRYPRAKKSHDETTFYTKMCAWDGFGMQTASTWGPAIIGWETLKNQFVDLHRSAIKLSFVPETQKRVGAVLWNDELPPEHKPKNDSGRGLSVYAFSVAVAALLGAWLWLRPWMILPLIKS